MRRESTKLAERLDPEELRELMVAYGEAGQQGTPPEATCFFKHALVQDAAYDSLLERGRLKRHAEIARTIEERFPDIGDTESEVLARHYIEAGTREKGAICRNKAGRKTRDRWALEGALSAMRRALQPGQKP